MFEFFAGQAAFAAHITIVLGVDAVELQQLLGITIKLRAGVIHFFEQRAAQIVTGALSYFYRCLLASVFKHR